MTTHEKLRQWRMKHGLSQAQAAVLVGTAQRTWAQWELKATPEVDFCEAIERLTKGHVSVKDWVRSRRKLRRLDAEKRERTESSTDLLAVQVKAS